MYGTVRSVHRPFNSRSIPFIFLTGTRCTDRTGELFLTPTLYECLNYYNSYVIVHVIFSHFIFLSCHTHILQNKINLNFKLTKKIYIYICMYMNILIVLILFVIFLYLLTLSIFHTIFSKKTNEND